MAPHFVVITIHQVIWPSPVALEHFGIIGAGGLLNLDLDARYRQ